MRVQKNVRRSRDLIKASSLFSENSVEAPLMLPSISSASHAPDASVVFSMFTDTLGCKSISFATSEIPKVKKKMIEISKS